MKYTILFFFLFIILIACQNKFSKLATSNKKDFNKYLLYRGICRYKETISFFKDSIFVFENSGFRKQHHIIIGRWTLNNFKDTIFLTPIQYDSTLVNYYCISKHNFDIPSIALIKFDTNIYWLNTQTDILNHNKQLPLTLICKRNGKYIFMIKRDNLFRKENIFDTYNFLLDKTGQAEPLNLFIFDRIKRQTINKKRRLNVAQ